MKKTILFTFLLILWASFAIAGGNYTQLVLPDFRIPMTPSSGVNPNVDFVGLGDGDVTSLRNSVAKYWDADGVLQEAAINVPRFEYVGGHWAYLGEPEGTNECLYNRDFTNAAWVKTNVTAAKTQTGIDGVANSCSSLTASAADGTVLQTVTLGADDHNFYVYVKRLTGTGDIFITDDNGGNYTDITSSISSDTWYKAEITRSQANPVVGFKIATDTDAIIVDYAQVEEGKKFGSSPIYTEGSAVTRATEGGGYPRWGLPEDMLGTGNMFEETLHGSDLIIDGDFENGSAGDPVIPTTFVNSGQDAGENSAMSATVHGGAAAYELDVNAVDEGIRQNTVDLSDDVGSVYKFSGWFKRLDGTSTIRIRITNGDGSQYMVSPYLTTGYDAGYTNYTCYFVNNVSGAGANLRIISAGGGANWLIDDLSLKRVTNPWNGLPPHGTIVLRWRPGYDEADVATDNGILSTRTDKTSLIYHDVGGNGLAVNDGTTEGVDALAFSTDTWYKIAIQWGYLTDNVVQMRIGQCASGSNISWGTAVDYDGAFTVGSYLQLLYDLLGPAHIRLIEGWRRILSNGEINNLGD